MRLRLLGTGTPSGTTYTYNYVTNGRTTNDLEGFFSIFKRGMRGIYQHCNEKHLHRYLAEFEFRYNTRIANGFDDRGRARERHLAPEPRCHRHRRALPPRRRAT